VRVSEEGREGAQVEFWTRVWNTYTANRETIVPLLTFASGLLTIIVGSIVAYAALKQARTATRRHEEQTKADLQRRITESFSEAVAQLGSEKLQVRLGGIYSLERISRESTSDYWPIMEILTGFVREEAPWKSDDTPPGSQRADIAAILGVIMRRDAGDRERERAEKRRLDFTSTDLRSADLRDAHLEESIFRGAHLDGAILVGAHLQGALLHKVRLKSAVLVRANLEGATLHNADLDGAVLDRANLKRVLCFQVSLKRAHLGSANLEGARPLTQSELDEALGNAETILPEGLVRPAHWLKPKDE